MAVILKLPDGVRATLTAYVKSPLAGLAHHARLRSVTAATEWAAKDLLEHAVQQMNEITGLGDARAMTGPEIFAYLQRETS